MTSSRATSGRGRSSPRRTDRHDHPGDPPGRREAILEIARRYGAHDIRVFGSVARRDAGDSSDLDVIVRFEPYRSLPDHGGLLMDLRELLGVKVDVISEAGMRPALVHDYFEVDWNEDLPRSR